MKTYIHTNPMTRLVTFHVELKDGMFLKCDELGNVIAVKYVEGQDAPHLFQFTDIGEMSLNQLLQSLVDAAGSRDIYAVASHRDQIKAEAIASERAEVIEWERSQFGMLLDRVLGVSLYSPANDTPAPDPGIPLQELWGELEDYAEEGSAIKEAIANFLAHLEGA